MLALFNRVGLGSLFATSQITEEITHLQQAHIAADGTLHSPVGAPEHNEVFLDASSMDITHFDHLDVPI